jgi:hypothetical protein
MLRKQEPINSYNEFAKEIAKKFSIALKVAKRNITLRNNNNVEDKKYAYKKKQKLKPKDIVWYALAKLPPGTTKKLAYRNIGPYEIESLRGNNAMIVSPTDPKDRLYVNVGQLRLQISRRKELDMEISSSTDENLPAVDDTPPTPHQQSPPTKIQRKTTSRRRKSPSQQLLENLRLIYTSVRDGELLNAFKTSLKEAIGEGSAWTTSTKVKKLWENQIVAANTAATLRELIDAFISQNNLEDQVKANEGVM